MRGEGGEDGVGKGDGEKIRNHWSVTIFAVFIWTVIAAVNIASFVLSGKGQSGA